MKILFAIPFFSPSYGGTVNSVFLLSKCLSKRGHKISIITSDLNYDKNYVKTLEELGVSIIPFHCVVNFGLFIYTPSLKKWLRNNIQDYDIVHLHSYRTYINIQVSKYANKKNIPLILQAHGSVLPIFEKKLIKKIFDVIWGKKLLKIAAKCIALTKSEALQYIQMGVSDHKIEIIPNGLDLSQFSNLPKSGGFRLKYDISLDEKIILFLGRIHKIKGIDLLIDAYAELVDRIPNLRLVISGPNDSYLSELKKHIQQLDLPKMPLFTGALYGQDKILAYIDADVFVLPSRYEIFGNTVLEAWACGTPVIVTTECHIADVVKKAGIVVERNPTKMAGVINNIVMSDPLRRELIVKGESLVKNEFNLAKISLSMEKLYIQLIKENLGNI